MIFLLFDLPTDNPAGHGSASVWVDSDDIATACKQAEDKLRSEGHAVFTLLDAMPSSRDDYFPPCQSLDAFNRAEKEGIALRYT